MLFSPNTKDIPQSNIFNGFLMLEFKFTISSYLLVVKKVHAIVIPMVLHSAEKSSGLDFRFKLNNI